MSSTTSSAPATITFNGQPALQLQSPDGAQAVVLLHGAHLVSWRPAGPDRQPGDEQLYLSERAIYAEGQAVRGGVPVIFPQFEKRGPLPRHGLARTRHWEVAESRVGTDHAVAVLRLVDDDATKAHWPHAFEAELTVSISGPRLDIELAVINTDQAPLHFTAALHTYLRVADVNLVRLEGLSGLRYIDSTSGEEHLDFNQTLQVHGEVDRIYMRATQTLLLRDQGRRVALESQGFDDVVVWNPGPEKCSAMPDMPPEGWREMLCVEAARITHPIDLPPGEEWAGRQSLLAL
ncbi:D-hexose-6-phosphate mutarotase [Aquabacterium sp.]|uniref:D-hexose-6-phosphate mutarotase n=1 Tax=Aquabacterium sp. TaxID=1872578 RepID=UPI0035AE113D